MATKEESARQHGQDLITRSKPKVGPAPKKPARITEMIEAIKEVDIGSLTQPDHDEIFNDHSISTVVDKILEIINRYEKEGIDARVGHIHNDAIRLGALLTTLSMHCSRANAQSYYAEENLKYLGAAIYTKANAYALDKGVHMTGNDYTSLSRMYTKREREQRLVAQSWDRMLNNLYFTAKQFMLTLASMSQRYPTE